MTLPINIVLNNTKIMSDTLRDFKVVHLYYNDKKVGTMEFIKVETPLQGSRYVLRSYKIDSEYSELFKGEESPLSTIMTYVKTLIV
jgi:hypothetical protein